MSAVRVVSEVIVLGRALPYLALCNSVVETSVHVGFRLRLVKQGSRSCWQMKVFFGPDFGITCLSS